MFDTDEWKQLLADYEVAEYEAKEAFNALQDDPSDPVDLFDALEVAHEKLDAVVAKMNEYVARYRERSA